MIPRFTPRLPIWAFAGLLTLGVVRLSTVIPRISENSAVRKPIPLCS